MSREHLKATEKPHLLYIENKRMTSQYCLYDIQGVIVNLQNCRHAFSMCGMVTGVILFGNNHLCIIS